MNGSMVSDVKVSLSEGETRVVPFHITDGQDNGGSLVVITTIDDVLALQVSSLSHSTACNVLRF